MSTVNYDAELQSPQRHPSVTEAQMWLTNYLADLLKLDPGEIDTTTTFDAYGLDSTAAVGLTGDLEEWLGFEVDPAAPYDYPTIEALAQHLAQPRG